MLAPVDSPYSRLTHHQASQMHQACLDILQNTGVRLYEQEAVDLLRDAGCAVEDGSLVRIPPDLVEHAIEVAGIDHVGFGSDFDGVPELPDGISDCTSWGAVTDALAGAGLNDEEIDKVACDNWRRVFRV